MLVVDSDTEVSSAIVRVYREDGGCHENRVYRHGNDGPADAGKSDQEGFQAAAFDTVPAALDAAVRAGAARADSAAEAAQGVT